MKALKLSVALFLLTLFPFTAKAAGLWALSGQIVLSGAAIGTVPVSVPITSVADGHYFSEASCNIALAKLMHAPVLRATSTAVGLYYTDSTSVDGIPTGTPGSEIKFTPLAGVAKTVMASCIPIGQ